MAEAVRTPVASRGALFLSDLHLGAAWGEPKREMSVCEMLATLAPSVEDVVLGGDVFEFWFEWRHVLPRLGEGLLETLTRLADTRRIWMVRGNHDFAMGSAFRERGIRVVDDGVCLSIDGGSWIFMHGDGMAPSDRLDRAVRRLLRSPVSQWAYRSLLHPDWAMAIALGTGKASRSLNPGPAPNVQEYEQQAFAWMEAADLRGLVHGHTHRPFRKDIGGRSYVNNGDWCRNRSRVLVNADGAILEDLA